MIGLIGDNLPGDDFNPGDVYAATAVLVLCVYMRFLWMHLTGERMWLFLTSQTGTDISTARFVNDLHSRIHKSKSSVGDFMEWLVQKYVVDQAKRVHYERAGSYIPRSWFHEEGGLFRHDRDHGPRYRNSRFESVTTILGDLGLVRIHENGIELTSEGKRSLQTIQRTRERGVQ